MRIDEYLAKNGIIKSREQAKALILRGGISVNGRTVAKPSVKVDGSEDIAVVGETLKYAGRGGLKLEKALEVFGISLEGKKCADLGASTGGFTDCMLKNGASAVYAVDVGHGQLVPELASDIRVINMEGFNVRDLSSENIDGKADFVGCDLSFISLKLIIPNIAGILSEDGEAVLLIKPQFECGRENIGKNGIVRSPKVHIRVIKEIISEIGLFGLGADMLDFSPVKGGSGNIEYLVHVVFAEKMQKINVDPEKTVTEAFTRLKTGK